MCRSALNVLVSWSTWMKPGRSWCQTLLSPACSAESTSDGFVYRGVCDVGIMHIQSFVPGHLINHRTVVMKHQNYRKSVSCNSPVLSLLHMVPALHVSVLQHAWQIEKIENSSWWNEEHAAHIPTRSVSVSVFDMGCDPLEECAEAAALTSGVDHGSGVMQQWHPVHWNRSRHSICWWTSSHNTA